jgi:hypothetical protein
MLRACQSFGDPGLAFGIGGRETASQIVRDGRTRGPQGWTGLRFLQGNASGSPLEAGCNQFPRRVQLRTGSSHGRSPRTPAAVKAPIGCVPAAGLHIGFPASDCGGTPRALEYLEPDAQPPAGRALAALTSLPYAKQQTAQLRQAVPRHGGRRTRPQEDRGDRRSRGHPHGKRGTTLQRASWPDTRTASSLEPAALPTRPVYHGQ